LSPHLLRKEIVTDIDIPTHIQYRTGKTLGSGTYAIVKEAVHIKTGKYYACKVINKKLMEGREYMVRVFTSFASSDCATERKKREVLTHINHRPFSTNRSVTKLPCSRRPPVAIATS
jgi:serine/threonine protein kinase